MGLNKQFCERGCGCVVEINSRRQLGRYSLPSALNIGQGVDPFQVFIIIILELESSEKVPSLFDRGFFPSLRSSTLGNGKNDPSRSRQDCACYTRGWRLGMPRAFSLSPISPSHNGKGVAALLGCERVVGRARARAQVRDRGEEEAVLNGGGGTFSEDFFPHRKGRRRGRDHQFTSPVRGSSLLDECVGGACGSKNLKCEN